MSEFLHTFSIILAFGFALAAMISVVAADCRTVRGSSFHVRMAVIYLVLSALMGGTASVTG